MASNPNVVGSMVCVVKFQELSESVSAPPNCCEVGGGDGGKENGGEHKNKLKSAFLVLA